MQAHQTLLTEEETSFQRVHGISPKQLREEIIAMPHALTRRNKIARLSDRACFDMLDLIIAEACSHYESLLVDRFFKTGVETKNAMDFLKSDVLQEMQNFNSELLPEGHPYLVEMFSKVIEWANVGWRYLLNREAIEKKPRLYQQLQLTLIYLYMLRNFYATAKYATQWHGGSMLRHTQFFLKDMDFENQVPLIKSRVLHIAAAKLAPLFFLELCTWLDGYFYHCYYQLPPHGVIGTYISDVGKLILLDDQDHQFNDRTGCSKSRLAVFSAKFSHSLFFAINPTKLTLRGLKQEAAMLATDIKFWLYCIPSMVKQSPLPLDVLLLITVYLTDLPYSATKKLYDDNQTLRDIKKAENLANKMIL